MDIKAIGFDIGGTLVDYKQPLNWSASYRDAIKYMCEKNETEFTEERFEQAKSVLEKYNTRVNPREKEIPSNVIFTEILEKWKIDLKNINNFKKYFYEFFQREIDLYDDAKILLKYCKENNIKVSVYTDVAYGMDDEYSLKDIEEISDYIDLKLTSENVGYRKPNKKGFETMIKKFECTPKEMMYVGDEKKDIVGAKNVGMMSVLINRTSENKDFEQDYTVTDLSELIKIIRSL